jgi:hypothetical protein
MKLSLVLILVLYLSISAGAQRKYISISAYNTQTALPFGKFLGSFTDQFHPGAEAGLGKNFSTRKKHDWFLELKAGYFFHRFVQHGIPLYLDLGYRYKFNSRLSAETAIGAGYLHSVPATAKLKLNENGTYESNKGIGRMQAMATYGLGIGYTLNPGTVKPITLFINYQQRIQMPFVKSYVPLLPYNSFMIGIRKILIK